MMILVRSSPGSRRHFKRPFRRKPAATMKSNSPKKVAPAKKLSWTLQRVFDKWFLPSLFAAIGGVIVWALWRR
jgi:hypothetical protein